MNDLLFFWKIISKFCLFQPGQMFPQSSGWGGGQEWYGNSMGPPAAHPRPPQPSQLTFDNAYNFHGSAHVMTQSMQPEFQLAAAGQHHPFSPASSAGSRPVHTPTTLMYDAAGGYQQAAAGLPYHVSMTAGAAGGIAADKSSLLQLSAATASTGVRQAVAHHGPVVGHHQGNLQPGYPPRLVETTSHSCENKQLLAVKTSSSCVVSAGYPGLSSTGSSPSHPPVTRVQDGLVTSSNNSRGHHTKDTIPHLPPPPPPDYGSRIISGINVNPPPLMYGGSIPEFTNLVVPTAVAPGNGIMASQLHSPSSNNIPPPPHQPTFLACSAAVELATDDLINIAGTKFEQGTLSSQTSSSNLDNEEDSLSSLARTPAAPTTADINNNKQIKFENSESFVSSSIMKALQNTTSSIINNSWENNSNICKQIIPQLDGNFDDPDFLPFQEEDDQYFEENLANSAKKKRSRNPRKMEGKDEENITLRTPLEVYRDILEDEDSFGDMTEEQKQKLSLKASQLKEISPDCHCSQQGLKGRKIKAKKLMKKLIFNIL